MIVGAVPERAFAKAWLSLMHRVAKHIQYNNPGNDQANAEYAG